MAIPTLYETDMGDQSIDVSASERKFQTSIIVKQDTSKDGILSFLGDAPQTISSPPTSQAPQTMTPSPSTALGGGSTGGASSGGYQ
tara:strand:+ start:95 stop:352 length:258 start_codon:yes stop_codon:yes gene_type:complete